jgi:hypothetical protein
MARAWIELPDPGWAAVRLARGKYEALCYAVSEVRGTGGVWLRLAGARLDSSALWIMPPG